MPTASSRKYGKYSRTSSGKFRLSVATERQTGTRVHDRMRHGHGFGSHICPAQGNGRKRVFGRVPVPPENSARRSQRPVGPVGPSDSSADSPPWPVHSVFSPKHTHQDRYACSGPQLPAKPRNGHEDRSRLSMPARRFFDSESRRSGLFAYFCLQTTRVC